MKKVVFILILGFSLFLFPSKKEKLDAINKQIDNIKTKLGKLKKEKRSILNDIYEIELKYERVRIESNKISLNLVRRKKKLI